MSVIRIMEAALNTNFQFTDDFTFFVHNNKHSFDDIASNMTTGDLFDVCVISVNTPQISSAINPILLGGAYRIFSSLFQPFTFSIVVRDLEGLGIKEHFTKIWMDQQKEYFDDIKSSVNITVKGKKIFGSDNCLISSVSQSDFDNNNSQISEFTVEFMSPTMSNTSQTDFGALAS